VKALFTPRRIFVFFAVTSLIVLVLAYQFTAPIMIDVGSGSDTALVEGFSFREDLSDGENFRWSDQRAEIRFWGVGNQEGALKLRLAAPQPNHLQVFANDHLLGELDPGAGFGVYTFPITRSEMGMGGDLIITLTTGMTFTAPPDTRNLGVQVDYARFESQGAPVLPAARGLYLVALTLLAFVITRAWSGNLRVGVLIGALAILAETFGVIFARVETIWFVAPLFWFGLLLFVGAILFAGLLRRFSETSLPVRKIFAVMAIAFLVRMIWATGPGFIVDVQDYVVWSYKTVTYGFGTMYSSFNGLWISDQSPGLNYIIHVMGLIYRAVFSPDFLYPGVAGDPNLRVAQATLTNPALLADPDGCRSRRHRQGWRTGPRRGHRDTQAACSGRADSRARSRFPCRTGGCGACGAVLCRGAGGTPTDCYPCGSGRGGGRALGVVAAVTDADRRDIGGVERVNRGAGEIAIRRAAQFDLLIRPFGERARQFAGDEDRAAVAARSVLY